MKLIRVDELWKCETCFHYRNGKCDMWCDTGESYRPAYSKFHIIDSEVVDYCDAEFAPVVHARWISQEVLFSNGKLIEECGNCMEWSADHNKSYCPNCGATMDATEYGD